MQVQIDGVGIGKLELPFQLSVACPSSFYTAPQASVFATICMYRHRALTLFEAWNQELIATRSKAEEQARLIVHGSQAKELGWERELIAAHSQAGERVILARERVHGVFGSSMWRSRHAHRRQAQQHPYQRYGETVAHKQVSPENQTQEDRPLI